MITGRFVILEHDWNGIHYDLMLELDQVLRTWRLTSPLHLGEQSAEQLPDHRLFYLDYEGPLSGNRGSVKRVLSGYHRLVDQTANKLVFDMIGDIVGQLEFQILNGKHWRLIRRPVLNPTVRSNSI